MNEFKFSINSLCSNLNRLLNSDLKSEHFRLAKFNKTRDDVVPTLWDVLYKLLNIPDAVPKSVKLKMLNLKYKRVQFYALPDDMSYGSRELLLALSYLVSLGLLDQLVSDLYRQSPFVANDDDLITSDRPRSKITFKEVNENNYDDVIQWSKGRIKINLRGADDYNTHITKLARKIQDNSNALRKLKPLSPTEILSLYNDVHCTRFLDATDRIVKIMELHEIWLKQAPLFWKWMASVTRQHDEDRLNVEELKNFFYNENVS